MKYKHVCLFLFLLGLSVNLVAQVGADPLDYFYDDLVVWETMGLVNNLPQARPYPLQMVKQILNTVIEKGDRTQRLIAEAYYRRYFGRVMTIGGKSELDMNMSDSGTEMAGALSFDINYELEEYLSVSGSADVWAINKLPNDEILPTWVEPSKDNLQDDAHIGPFYILPSLNASVAVGNPQYYLNVGLMRGSFGPFHANGVIAGPQALHTGQYSFALNKPKWGFNMTLYSLTGSNGFGEKYAAEDLVNERAYNKKWYPQKYLSVHSFDYRPSDKFSISFFESVIYGGRLDLLYLLPFSPYMVSQGLVGFNDNCFLGGMFTVKPIQGMKIDGVLYADDIDFNGLMKGNIYTKLRMAGQLGVAYAPQKSGIFTLASLDYTMIMPYMYSHINETGNINLADPNYQNYLHADSSFGAALDPNSDRINVKIKLRPLEDVDFDIVGVLIRHANVNEGIRSEDVRYFLTNQNKYITDGTALNAAGISDGNFSYNSSNPFLTQATTQYIWQTGFDATCRLPVLKTGGYMVFRFGYRFECNMNKNVNNRIYTYDPTVTFVDINNPTPVELATFNTQSAAQLAAWKAAAGGVDFGNYLRAGFEYYY